MAYATVADVQQRMIRELSAEEQGVCTTLLEDAAVIIDRAAKHAGAKEKCAVSCRMVIRALGDGNDSGYPLGATQGSMSGLGYSQSWTISGGSNGELYLTRTERSMLGIGNRIGSYSPVEECSEVYS